MKNQTSRLFQPESIAFVTHLRALLDSVSKSSDKPRALLVDPGNLGWAPTFQQIFSYYGNESSPGAHVVVSQQLVSDTSPGLNFAQRVDEVNMAATKNNVTLGYLTAGTYVPRETNVLRVAAILLLPGAPLLYYGQELGMTTKTLIYERSGYMVSALTNASRICRPLFTQDNENAYNSIPMHWNGSSLTAGLFSWDIGKTNMFNLEQRKPELQESNYLM